MKDLKNLLIICAFLLAALPLRAETREMRDSLRHEVRIGWGDQLFETLIWHQAAPRYPLPAGATRTCQEDYRYTQHWFAEYNYRITRCVGVGLKLDGSGVLWNNIERDHTGNALSTTPQHFYNLAIVPMARFTYLNKEYVSLHSAIGFGLNINGGTETNIKGQHTDAAMAVDLCLIGITVGHGHWFGSAELGGLFSMKGQQYVFMLGSRLVSASVGYRF